MSRNLNCKTTVGKSGRWSRTLGSSLISREESIDRPFLKIRTVDEFTVVEVIDADLILEDQAVNRLANRLQRLVETGAVELLLNLNGMNHASSDVLGKLAWLNRKVVSCHGHLRIFGLHPELLEALRICRLDRVFELHADEDEALADGFASRR